MATSEILETGRLILEPFSEKHLSPRYVSWLNDPEVVRFSQQRWIEHSLDSCKTYMDSFAGTPNYFWAIASRAEGEGYIGTMTSYLDLQNGVADIGILIGEKRLWGKGYGLEALRAAAGFLFRDAGMRKVTAGTVAVNRGMLKIMERAGMKHDGRRSRQLLFEGREEDIVHGALFREEWQESEAKFRGRKE
jgi:[ribosomal protein S5]-alanine N-acetyltransferase